MSPDVFHQRPFDEATKTKLRIFELYAGEWLPVFLSPSKPKFTMLHIYDFFAGSGTDSEGVHGSPLRLLSQLLNFQSLPGWHHVTITVHLYDRSQQKIELLKNAILDFQRRMPEVIFDIQTSDFTDAFEESTALMGDPNATKLVLLDQFGVDIITNDVFNRLIRFPRCDFLFFVASSIFYRFFQHPAIKMKITKPSDYYSCHRATFDYYKGLIPPNRQYFLAPFSIKKGSNIYGIIFGSAHPLGIAKFLSVAWKSDSITGEANFDIDRQEILPGQTVLAFDEASPIKKLAVFEDTLEKMLRQGQLQDELEVLKVCFDFGVRPQHATEVLSKLKREKLIDLTFRVPNVTNWKQPRKITFLQKRLSPS